MDPLKKTGIEPEVSDEGKATPETPPETEKTTEPTKAPDPQSCGSGRRPRRRLCRKLSWSQAASDQGGRRPA
jgi:hypothetical protein